MRIKLLGIFTLLFFTQSAFAVLGLSRVMSEDLRDTDLTMMMEHAREKMDGKKVGTVLTWQNEETKNSGTVTLKKVFTHNNHQCRIVEHKVHLDKDADGFQYVSTICKDSNNTWFPIQ